jgi:hypothetical protein
MYDKLAEINQILKKHHLREIPNYSQTHTEGLDLTEQELKNFKTQSLYNKLKLQRYLLATLATSLIGGGLLRDNEDAVLAEKEIYALLAEDLDTYLYEGKFADRNQGGNGEMFPLEITLFTFPHHKKEIVDKLLKDSRHFEQGKLDAQFMPVGALIANAPPKKSVQLLTQYPDELKNLKRLVPNKSTYQIIYSSLFEHYKPDLLIKDFDGAVDAFNYLAASYLEENALQKSGLQKAILDKLSTTNLLFEFLARADFPRKLIATKLVIEKIKTIDSVQAINELIRSMNLISSVAEENGKQYKFVNPHSQEIIKIIIDNSNTPLNSSRRNPLFANEFLDFVKYHDVDQLPNIFSSAESKIIELMKNPIELSAVFSTLNEQEFHIETIIKLLDKLAKGQSMNQGSTARDLFQCYTIVIAKYPKCTNVIKMLEASIPQSIKTFEDVNHIHTIVTLSVNAKKEAAPLLQEIKELMVLAVSISRLFKVTGTLDPDTFDENNVRSFEPFFEQFKYNNELKKAWDYACMPDREACRNALVAELKSTLGGSSSSRPFFAKWMPRTQAETSTAEQVVDRVLKSNIN